MNWKQVLIVTVFGILAIPFGVAGFIACLIGHGWSVDVYRNLWQWGGR